MTYKQYKIYSGGQEFNLNNSNLSWTALSDKKMCFTIKVTNWDDNGYITGTYELNNLSPTFLNAFREGRLCVGVVRHRSASQKRKSAYPDRARKVRDRIEANNYYVLNSTSGTFRLNKPSLDSGNLSMASYIKNKYNAAFEGYMHVRLGLFKLIRANGGTGSQYSPFIAVPNTQHTFFYDIDLE